MCEYLVWPVSFWNPAIARARKAALLPRGKRLESKIETRIQAIALKRIERKNFLYKIADNKDVFSFLWKCEID